MDPTLQTVAAWLEGLPDGATHELVQPGFWYVRLPGTNRLVIPLELESEQRSLKVTSHFCMEPEDDRDEAYAFLLKHNHRGRRVAFSLDRERTVCITGRLGTHELTQQSLDELVGQIVDLTESTFRSFLALGFSRRFASAAPPRAAAAP